MCATVFCFPVPQLLTTFAGCCRSGVRRAVGLDALGGTRVPRVKNSPSEFAEESEAASLSSLRLCCSSCCCCVDAGYVRRAATAAEKPAWLRGRFLSVCDRALVARLIRLLTVLFGVA
ncbi:hypothetical protein TraAM80_05391 [Trypanosoma rangeli]|uniref:Uncharacterized protein n=1 Tax=Trypanosoma rangeli TaxID=5698 RepID=A0A422NFL5_TRYRA|nr:uncharacterized protein TraAM80_05391 [Trypanosoma rangeli]RNF04255.1 hypothetical protein TraAM80_05391 [Trypanosoma rangeli]|eukprot:RNF04255.1 hypothetical protein TraAM80_05391 [Trypanosoma rangeli]